MPIFDLVWGIAPSILIATVSNLQNCGHIIQLILELIALLAKIAHICPCPGGSPFIFYCNFIKLLDNQKRHKISDEFDFRLDHKILLGVTRP